MKRSLIRAFACASLLLALAGKDNAVPIAHDHTGSGGPTVNSPSSYTFPMTVSANTGVLIWSSVEDTNTISSIAGGSVSWTFVALAHDAANARNLELWAGYSTGALSGSTITMNLTNPAVHQECCVYDSFTGTATSAFVEAFNATAQTSQTLFTGTVTTLHSNSEGVMAATAGIGGATAGTGYTIGSTLAGVSNTSLSSVYANAVTPSPSTISPLWTPFASGSGVTLAAALRDANASTRPPVFTIMGVGP